MEHILQINAVSKRYGKIQAVDKLSLEVERGNVFGILGPNGSGKTTTLGIILNMIAADEGSFLWFGKPLTKHSRTKIGTVFEAPQFYPYLSAETNLKIAADIKGVDYKEISQALELTGLLDRRKSKFRTFSLGMKQRLSIASALLGNPSVMILDEPTNGLDPQGIAQIRELIISIASRGITIIIASHMLDEVQKICTHVAVLKKGQKLFSGDVQKVLSMNDSIEVAASDTEKLLLFLKSFPGIQSVKPESGFILVTFTDVIDPSLLNEFMFKEGISLTHLCIRKKSLEKHFLELLAGNQ